MAVSDVATEPIWTVIAVGVVAIFVGKLLYHIYKA